MNIRKTPNNDTIGWTYLPKNVLLLVHSFKFGHCGDRIHKRDIVHYLRLMYSKQRSNRRKTEEIKRLSGRSTELDSLKQVTMILQNVHYNRTSKRHLNRLLLSLFVLSALLWTSWCCNHVLYWRFLWIKTFLKAYKRTWGLRLQN